MTEAINQPPKLQKTANGDLNINSLADVLEWFLNYDQRVGLMRHPHVEELFEWKQADDAARGIETYPFENAEARFAVGVFQAIAENDSEAKLALWMTDVLQALGDAKQTVEDFTEQYKLETKKGASFVAESQKLPSKNERRVFLTSAWIEALTTAEVRFLGWIYRELYKKPFQPDIK
ncbi:MAG: hypothetical protein ACR2GD_00280 [Pyrinomonadaceae bacterium]